MTVQAGFDIIVCLGQSNMAGRGTLDLTVDTPAPFIRQYGCFASSANFQKVIQGSDPLEYEEAVETGKVGPATAFARAYRTNNPNRQVLLVPVAHGGTALVGGPWAAGNPGGSLYETAITRSNEAVTAAQAVAPSSRVVGIGWLQGETDGNTAQATYAAALDAVIAGLRSRITGASGSWFAVLQMLQEYINTTNGAVNAAHVDTPNRNSRCVFVANPGLGYSNGDNLHFNAPGQRLNGAAWASAVIGL